MPSPTDLGLPVDLSLSARELTPAPAAPRLSRLLEALRRQRWLALSVVAGFVALAGLASVLVRPYYVADASLIIEPPNLHLAELTPPSYPPPVDLDRELQTELTVLGSHLVAAPVIRDLDLEQRDPEIAAALQGVERSLAHKGWHLSAATREQIADGVFAHKLQLLPDKISSTVHVEYGSDNAALAAEVANALTASFLDEALAARQQAGDRTLVWMRQQLADASAERDRDQAAIESFQQQNQYVPLSGGAQPDPLLERLDEADHALSGAQAASITSQALLASYGNGSVAALPAELHTTAIDRQVDNVGAAQSALTALEATYRPEFPLVVEARQRLASEQAKLASLRADVTAGLRERADADARQVAQLQQLVDGLSQQAAAASAVGLRYGALKERAEAQQALVATLREKLNEVELSATLPVSNIQLLDAATTPLQPAYPRLALDLGLGAALGLALALALVLARERWSERVTDPDELTRALGEAVAPLGLVPDGARTLRSPAGQVLLPAVANGAPLESYARIAAHLVARCGPAPRAILITSANPEEGKTMTTCQLGLALAAAGWRTLVVDADIRHPGCNRLLGLDSRLGLIAAQQGVAVAPEPVVTHLDLLGCESGQALPLQAPAMAKLLADWKSRYDYILVDSPPGNLTGDAVLLSALVEAVVVVVRWGETRLGEAQRLCLELARARAPLLGTVINRTDPRAPAYRYYRRHQDYFHSQPSLSLPH